MMKSIIAAIICLSTLTLYAGDGEFDAEYPLWGKAFTVLSAPNVIGYSQDATATDHCKSYGLKLSPIVYPFDGDATQFYGVALSLFGYYSNRFDVAGVDLSLSASFINDLSGVQVAPLTTFASDVSGVQCGLLCVASEMTGVQLGGCTLTGKSAWATRIAIVNGGLYSNNAISIAAAYNHSEHLNHSLQFTLGVNTTDTSEASLQCGLFNYAATQERGLQFGIINVAKSGQSCLQVGLINICGTSILPFTNW